MHRGGPEGPAERYEHRAVQQETGPRDPGTCSGLEGPIVEGDQRDRGRSGRRRSRSEAASRSPGKGLGEEDSSRRQARLRRRHGPPCLREPAGEEQSSVGCSVSPGRGGSSSYQGSGSCSLFSSHVSLITRAADALPAAPQRGPQPGLLAEAVLSTALDLGDGAAVAWPAARCRHGHLRGDATLASEPAASSHQEQKCQRSELNAGTRTDYVEMDMRDSVQPNGSVKRRRIRGKQPQPWTSACASTAFAVNSVQAADSAGPSRSAHLHEDRFAACGDRDGQALGPSAGADAGAAVARGAAVGDKEVALSAWRGRPPDAG